MLTLNDIFAVCLEDKDVAFQLKKGLSSGLVVPDTYLRQIGEFLVEFVEEHDTTHKEGDLAEWLSSLPDKQRAGVQKKLKRILDTDISEYTPDYVAQEALKTFRKKATNTAIKRLSRAKDVEPEDIEAFSEQIDAIEPVTISDMADLSEVDRWFRLRSREETVTTGIEKLNDRLGGGWQKGELGFILADSGVGKSTCLINHGFYASLVGANVFHLTLELAQENTARRFYRRVTEADRYDVRDKTKKLREDAREWWRFAEGNYYLLYRNPYSITPEELRRMIELHERQYGKIDILLLDYLDLMKPSPEDQSLGWVKQLGRISHSVRGIAENHNLFALTATQAKRPTGKEYEELSLSDMGDSYEKVRAGDIIIGFVRTSEEIEDNHGRYQLLKVRENPAGGGAIPLYVNLDLMHIAGLDHPNTRRIMRDRGDAPAPMQRFGA